MAAPRMLPPVDELKRCVEAGMTHQEIVQYIQEKHGRKVSRSSVSAALSRAGLTEREGARYKDELPWRVKADHMTQYEARMLRLLGRERSGLRLTDEEVDRLDSWLEWMEEDDIVVGYAPKGPGFIYLRNEEFGDGENGVPIRRREIQPDEFASPGEHG